jgi:hypothetical protein
VLDLDPNDPPGALISWRPSLDRWQVYFYNPGTVNVSAQTIAYCAPDPRGCSAARYGRRGAASGAVLRESCV